MGIFILLISLSSWAQFNDCGAAPVIGEECPGGALYAGYFQGAHYMVQPAGCTDNTRPICAGVRDTTSRGWNQQPDPILTAVRDLIQIPTSEIPSPTLQKGHITTPVLVDSPHISSSSPAHYCSNLNFGGYQDWVLPSKSEAAYLYCIADDGSEMHSDYSPLENPNCQSLGGKRRLLRGFQSEVYWTSTPTNNTLFWAQEFMTGNQYSLSRNTKAFVRCIRRFQLN